MTEQYKETDYSKKESKKVWDHLMIKGHTVADLEQTMKIDVHSHPEYEEFETWCCMHHDCNYLEYRLKEGHREDR